MLLIWTCKHKLTFLLAVECAGFSFAIFLELQRWRGSVIVFEECEMCRERVCQLWRVITEARCTHRSLISPYGLGVLQIGSYRRDCLFTLFLGGLTQTQKMFWFWSPLKNVLGVNLWICFSVWEKDWSRVVLIWACGVDLAPEGSQRVLCKQLVFFSSCQLVFSVYWRPGLVVTSVALNILSFKVENHVL